MEREREEGRGRWSGRERGGRKERNRARRSGENGFERWEGRRMDKLCDWILGRAINERV